MNDQPERSKEIRTSTIQKRKKKSNRLRPYYQTITTHAFFSNEQ